MKGTLMCLRRCGKESVWKHVASSRLLQLTLGGGGGYLKAVMYCKKDSVHLPSWTSNS